MRAPAPGFTLLEVLVALVIVGTALAACLRAIGSLTQNSSDLRVAMMATWSADARMTFLTWGIMQRGPGPSPANVPSITANTPECELKYRCWIQLVDVC
ncbi:MAG: type II secretion system minor pseudopilin GspI [Burkholderiales bacterium]|nr:type II secretion system minor pseudopilin GspI [Burkholderiales bacterium]